MTESQFAAISSQLPIALILIFYTGLQIVITLLVEKRLLVDSIIERIRLHE